MTADIRVGTPRGYRYCWTAVGTVPASSLGGTPAMATTQTYTVTGMTCAHCVNSVSTEVGQLLGVRDVQVDLAAGAVTVTSDEPLDEQVVAAAVDEARYALQR